MGMCSPLDGIKDGQYLALEADAWLGVSGVRIQ